MSVEIKRLGAVVKEFSSKGNVIKVHKKKFLTNIWEIWIAYAKSITPVKTWNLKNSYKFIQTTNQVKIFNSSKYFKFIDWWTKSHIIKPRNKKALKFWSTWNPFYSKWHMVKGIKWLKIADRTLKDLMNIRIPRELNLFLNKIAKK